MRTSRTRAALITAALALLAPVLQAQSFDSGSTGADGALSLTTPGTVVFDPKSFNPPLDPDGNNVYHFTSITIGPGVTVRLRGPELNMAPVFWLASGPVQIDGTIDLNGEAGHTGSVVLANRRPAIPGAGGYPGGIGGIPGSQHQEGAGLGRGQICGHGGGAGHNGTGCGCGGGATYGNNFLIPLLGGSGGAGGEGNGRHGGGGGAGGGAFLLASSVSIAVNGSITAGGGRGESPLNGGWGGGGSGGAIHLLAPTLSGTGAIRADGGTSGVNCGAPGRIRLEALQHLLTGTISPGPIRATPFTRDLTPASLPSVRVVSIGGVPVPPDPTGSFAVPDVTLDQGSAVTVAIEARNIPPGTVVKLHVFSEGGPDQIVNSTPLAGTAAQSTATASLTFPPGFSRGFVRVTWTP